MTGQLGDGRHGGSEVPAGRGQDVADCDAGGLVRHHGVSVVAEVVQQCRGDGVQQLLPANCCVLFTDQSTGDAALTICLATFTRVRTPGDRNSPVAVPISLL